MQRIIRDYIERSERAIGPDELRDAMATVIRHFDFHAFAFFALPEGREPLLISDYDERWTNHYVERHYQSRDPVMLRSRRVVSLFVWNASMAGEFGSLARDFFYEAEEFGIRCGVTVPIQDWPGGIAAMTFAAHRRAHLELCLRFHESSIFFLAFHFQSHLRRMLQPVRLVEGTELTPREYEILGWAAEGKSAADTAQIMNLSARIIARDLETLRAKLGVRSIGQAIALYAAYVATRRRGPCENQG